MKCVDRVVSALSAAVLSAVFNLWHRHLSDYLNAVKSNKFALKIPNLVMTDSFNLGQNKGRLIRLSIIEEKYKFALLICFYLHARFSMPHSFSVRKP